MSTESGSSQPSDLKGSLGAVAARTIALFSLTSWLPAAFFVATVGFGIVVRNDRQHDINRALSQFADFAVGTYFTLLVFIILAVVVTEAVAHEAMQTLEGHWSRNPASTLIATVKIRRHARNLQKMKVGERDEFIRAFAIARPRLLENIPKDVVEAIEQQVMMTGSAIKHTDSVWEDAGRVEWRTYLPPEVNYRLDSCNRQSYDFPPEHRILPTRLGNILRAAEDSLDVTVESLLASNFLQLSPGIVASYDRLRNLLQMYCLLVLMFPILALVMGGLLSTSPKQYQTTVVGGLLALSILSYRGAMASAQGLVSLMRSLSGVASAERTEP